MKKKRFIEKQIIAVLREHEVSAKRGDIARKHRISEATLYNCKAKFGGMDISDAKRLKAMEDEYSKLQRLLAEPSGINRIYRLCREEGLGVRKRKGRKRAIGSRAPLLVEAKANARWSLDFVHDQMAHGRRFRILNIVDDVTQECLAAIPDTSISGRRVARELTALIAQRGRLGMIVSDNGTEFTSHAVFAWAKEHCIDRH